MLAYSTGHVYISLLEGHAYFLHVVTDILWWIETEIALLMDGVKS